MGLADAGEIPDRIRVETIDTENFGGRSALCDARYHRLDEKAVWSYLKGNVNSAALFPLQWKFYLRSCMFFNFLIMVMHPFSFPFAAMYIKRRFDLEILLDNLCLGMIGSLYNDTINIRGRLAFNDVL